LTCTPAPQSARSPARLTRNASSTTPKRVRSSAAEGTPTKKQRKTVQTAAAEAKAQKVQVAEEKPLLQESADELNVLPLFFDGLDFILLTKSNRKLKGFYEAVKADVERMTKRELTDERLSRVLGLAPTMINVRWLGTGAAAKFEIFQLDKDGKELAPAMDEHLERKKMFKVAFDNAVRNGSLPRRDLPERPAPAKVDFQSQKSSSSGALVLPKQEVPAELIAPTGSDAKTRKQFLLERIRAREASKNSGDVTEFARIRHRISMIDAAATVVSVLQQLFARAPGKFSAAREDEILQVLCPTSRGPQSMKTLDKTVAHEAIALLVEHGSGWFTVQAGVHVPDAKYFRRSQEGSAKAALDALQRERTSLEKALEDLCNRHRSLRPVLPIQPMQPPSTPSATVSKVVENTTAAAPAATPCQAESRPEAPARKKKAATETKRLRKKSKADH